MFLTTAANISNYNIDFLSFVKFLKSFYEFSLIEKWYILKLRYHENRLVLIFRIF